MSSRPPIPDDVAALISAYALGALESDQVALAEQHIASSDECRRAYEDALETAAVLALAVADSEPPAELRGRIMAAARAERPPVASPAAPRRRRGLAGLLTPSSGFALIGVAAAIVARSRCRSTPASSARDRQDALVAILSRPTPAPCRSPPPPHIRGRPDGRGERPRGRVSCSRSAST
jgi:anti-sigma-K factor RskA